MSFSICGSVGGNTGGPDCDISKALPTGLVFGSPEFDSSDYVDDATFKAAFIANTKLATGSSDKLYPFPEIQGNTDKTAAPKEGSLGYGLNFVLLGARPGYEFDMIPGSIQEQAMQKFNKKTIPVFVLDDGQNIWGTRNRSTGVFKGFKVLVSIVGKGFDDGQNVKTTKVTISFVSADEFYKTAAFASTDLSIADLAGLMDGVLYEPTAHTTNVYKIGIKIETNQLGKDINVYDKYADELVAALFTAASGTTFQTSMPITSVAKDTTLKCFTFTLDSTAYGVLPSGAKVKIIPAAPPALDAADVTGLELYSLIVTK